ncbi:MAG TPA: hypothetical protein PKY82_12540 [Pyrinomonadaceae bacterium]|nr:hypothetical protein [Pyrinomonadaceae bacterium]
MRKIGVLIFCIVLASCSKVETSSTPNITKLIVSPTISEVVLKAVKPKVELNKRQEKYLNESLSPQAREVLENAEKFEVLAEVNEDRKSDRDILTFEPNRIAKIINENDKKEILESFYFDASREDPPASCYEPHHGLRATYQGKTVEIEICFSCSRFEVKSPFGNFEGTITRENPRSEKVLEKIIRTQGIELKN